VSRKPRAAVTIALALLLVVAAAWTVQAADNPAPNMFGLDKPEALVSVRGLCCPGLNCSMSAELDAGLLSMVRPILEQALQASAQIPGPAEGLGKAASVGWKPFMQMKQGDRTITLFQLPAKTPEGAAAEPPQGFVMVMTSSRQVITAGMLGQLDTTKLIPLLMQAGLGGQKANIEGEAPQ